jgi:hypothetical protein
VQKYFSLFFGSAWIIVAIGIVLMLNGCAKSNKALRQQNELEKQRAEELLEDLEDDLDDLPEDTGEELD